MEVIQKTDTTHVLRFDAGEEVLIDLFHYAARENITGATITAIGGVNDVELNFYDIEAKEYQKKFFYEYQDQDAFELLTATGTIGTLDGSPIIHLHGSLGKKDFSVVGGHITSMRVTATVEVVLTILPEPLTRKKDEETGLNLLSS